MVKIVSDSRKTEKILGKIVEIISENGGYLDPDIELRCKNGAISVHSPENRNMRTLCNIPHALLLPYEEFSIGIKGKKFILKSSSEHVSKTQLQLMKAMIELYNVTGQLEHHRRASPWIAYKSARAITDLLLSSREGAEFREIRSMLDRNETGEPLEKLTFFKTRLLNCSLHKQWRKKTAVLLPFVDAFNHNIIGAGFDHLYAPDDAFLSVQLNQSPEGSECFACYGFFDALDTYLHYGFIDQNTPITRSIPMQIDLGEYGIIDIRGLYASIDSEKFPEDMRDLKLYLPAIKLDRGNSRIELSHIFIPGNKAVLSMRRILKYTIKLINPDLDDKVCLQMVIETEKAVLDVNMRFYDRMMALSESMGFDENKHDLAILSPIQKSKIQSYNKAIISFQKDLQPKKNL